MKNNNHKLYINKVINIKSERLFREAEDDFFYFKKINSAYKKLKEGIELTPNHTKSIILLADICFMKGFYKKALELYKRGESLASNKAKIYASICNCYYSLNDYSNALKYSNIAFKYMNTENLGLFSYLLEIKVNIYINLKQYKNAYITFLQAQNLLDSTSIKSIYNTNYELINEKLNIRKKIKNSGLQIV